MPKLLIKAFERDLGLKILSIFLGIVIWYMVVNINDPVETASFTVRVTPQNESYIENGKQSFRIDDEYKAVVVYVKGNRSTLRKLNADDIVVTADLTQIVDLKRDPVMVPLSASAPGINATGITLSRTTIPIRIEDIDSKEFPVTVEVGSSLPGSDYEIGTLTANPETIRINGPESIINQLDSVIAQIDVTGMTRDGARDASLRLMDKNSNVISKETIADDLTFDGGVPHVEVQVGLWKKQSNIGFHVSYTGTPAAGYQVGKITTTPETTTLAGTDEALAGLKERQDLLQIPGNKLSVEGVSSDVTFSVPLKDILPEDTKLATGMADTVTVKISIIKNDSREMTIDVDDIRTEGLASNLAVSYDQTKLDFIVEGSSQAMKNLTPEEITATINLSELTSEGDYTVPVSISLPPGLSISGEAKLAIHLKPRAQSNT